MLVKNLSVLNSNAIAKEESLIISTIYLVMQQAISNGKKLGKCAFNKKQMLIKKA